ncbi:MAG: class I adenylate-forming enzyme family protein [Pseudomonadota bacterium]
MSLPAGFTHLSVSRGIRTSAARVPHKPAIEWAGGRVSYRTLTRRMNQLGHAVIGRYGLTAGDVVALIAPNRPEYLEVVAGLSDHGLVVATLNPRLAPAELDAIAADCQPKLVIIDPALGALAEQVRSMQIAQLSFGPDYEALLAKAADTAPKQVVPEWARFSICYTSGTTGLPKGVQLPHRSRALVAMASAIEYGCFGMSDRFLSLSPLYHGAGFAFAAAAISFGGTCVLYGNNDPAAMLERLGQGDLTGVFMVPTHFKRLFDLPETRFDGLTERHGLKTIISNAAALAQPFKDQTVQRFGPGLLHETYGSTEAGIVTNIRPDHILAKPGSVGTPFISMQVEIRRGDGSLCSPGETGELFAKGPYTFNGYLNRPEATEETLVDGWVTVQDLASMDEDGFITISGRMKDMVVSGGVNIYPAEIEAVIAKQPGVQEVAVVGLPDDEWGERVHAFVVGGGTPMAPTGAILDACRAQLSGYKVPRGITVIDELPRNPSGKILKRELRARQD